MTELAAGGQLTPVAFEAQLPVAFGAGVRLQLGAAVERLKWENPRLNQKAWGQGRRGKVQC